MHRILHLSDVHVGADNPDVPTAPEVRLGSVLAAVSSRGPFDAVVVTGDICEAGAESDARVVRHLLDGIAPIVLAVPGNHDESAVVRTVFGEPAATLGEWVVVGARTNVAGQVHGDGRTLAEAVARLADHAPDRPAVLLHHHPVHSRSTHPWFVLEHRDEAVDALARRSAPLLMLSGHTHDAFEARDGAVHFVGAPSTYYGIAHDAERWAPTPGATGAVVVECRGDGGSLADFVVA